LTWQHPIEANGPITFFNISVLPTIFFDEHEVIRVSLPVGQYNYYKYTIEGKRLMPSTSYTIKISAFNGHNGEEEVVDETSPPAIPFFEADPKTFPSNNTIAVKILPRVNGGKENFENQLELFLLIFDESINNKSHVGQLQRLQEDHHINLSKFRMLYHCRIKDMRGNYLTIGKESGTVDGCLGYENPPLNLSTTYKITILLVNTYLGKSSYKLHSFQAVISHEKNLLMSTILPLFAILLVMSVVILLSYYYVTKRKMRVTTQGTQGSGHERVPLVENPISKANEENASNKQDNFRSKYTHIKVPHFGKYVKDGLQDGMLKSQYEAIVQKFSHNYQNIRNGLILDYVDVRDVDVSVSKYN
jgi:competence protein ComGC